MNRTLSRLCIIPLLSTTLATGCPDGSGSSSSSGGGTGSSSDGVSSSTTSGDSGGGTSVGAPTSASSSSAQPPTSGATSARVSSSSQGGSGSTSTGGSTSGGSGGTSGSAPYHGEQESGAVCSAAVCPRGEPCCVPLGGEAACEPGGSCPGFGFSIGCDGPEDCNHDTEVCCADGLATACRPTADCAGPGTIGEVSRVCTRDADCQTGAGCCTLSGFVAGMLTSVDFGTCVVGGCGGGTVASSSGDSSSRGDSSSSATSTDASSGPDPSSGGSSSAEASSGVQDVSSSAEASSTSVGVSSSSGPNNQPPTFTNLPGTAEGYLGQPGSFTVDAVDPDDDRVEYSVSESSCVFNVQVNASTGVVEFTCSSVAASCTVTVTAHDNGVPPATAQGVLDIACVPHLPVFAHTPPASASEGVEYAYAVICTDPVDATTELSVAAGDTCGGVLLDDGTGTIRYAFMPDEADGGTTCTVAITCAAGGDEVSQQGSVSILETNLPPVLTLPGEVVSGIKTKPNGFTATAVDADVPAQVVSFSAMDSSCTFTVDVDPAGSVSWTCGGVEACTVTMVATDEGVPPADSAAQSVTIACTNDPPAFQGQPPTAVTESTTLHYLAQCTNDDGDSLEMDAGPADTCGGTVTDHGDGTGEYTFTPAAGTGGRSCVLSLTCDDGAAETVQTVDLSIAFDTSPWSMRAGDAAGQRATAVALGPSGDVVIVGSFAGGMDMGGGVLTSAGGTDIVVAVTDRMGLHKWSRRFGDSGAQGASAVAVGTDGAVVVGGFTGGVVDFGGGPLGGAGGNAAFLVKLTSAGAHVWSKVLGDGTGQSVVSAVAVAGSGDVVVGGSFAGTLNLGGGALTSAGGNDMFLATLNSAGAHLWSKRFGGASADDVTAVALDGTGNIYLGGSISWTVNMGGGSLVAAGSTDGVLASYTAAGEHRWSRVFGDAAAQTVSALAVSTQALYVAVTFAGAADLGGGALVSAGGNDMLVARLGLDGSHEWSRSLGDSSGQEARALAVGANDTVVLAGDTRGTVDGCGAPLAAAGETDILVGRFASDGACLSGHLYGDAGAQVVAGVVVTATDNPVVVGGFSGSVDFGAGALQSAGSQDLYVARLAP